MNHSTGHPSGPRLPRDPTRSPSVLRLITRLNIGGPAIQALLLTSALQDSHPTILAAGSVSADEGEMSDPAVAVERVPLVRPISPGEDVAAYRAVRQMIHDSGVRLVHTHMAKAGLIGRLAARRAPQRPATVHTFHGHVLEGYFSPPVQKAFIVLERWLARQTDALIAVSEEVRDSLLDLGIGSPGRFHVIPLGFDLSPFLQVADRSEALRAHLRLGPEVPLVGVVGRLTAIKDHDTLLRAMARVPSAHLAVVGDGERRAELEASLPRLGLEGRVHFLGWRSDIADCLADVDVVALTSRNEGTPVSLIEAGASSRPVVATDVGGVRSVVLDGETGFLTPPGDDTRIAAHLTALLSDADMRRRLGTAGRDHVRKRFDHSRLISDVGRLYDSLLPSRP